LKRFAIPQISDEQIQALRHIHPVEQSGRGWIEMKWPDPRRASFLWNPEPSGVREDLQEICRVRTLHTFGYHGFFKPSIAEVLAQIPPELLGAVVAFETKGPETAEDLNKNIDALNAGFQVAETILYRQRKEEA